MSSPAIQQRIEVLKIYLETAPEKLIEIRNLCTELATEINKYLQSQNDKRQYVRLDLVLPVTYALYKENGIKDVEQSGLIRDISLGGTMIEMKEKPLPGTPVLLNLQIGKNPVQVKGQTARIKDFKEDTWLVGIEFTEIEEKDLRVIFRFLAENYA